MSCAKKDYKSSTGLRNHNTVPLYNVKHNDSNLRAIIFDLDETLIHSKTNYHKMKSEILGFLESMDIPLEYFSNQMLNFQIMDIAQRELRTKGLSEDKVDTILSMVEKIMDKVELETLNKATMIRGANSVLEGLKMMGLKIGIVTNSCREYAEKVLRNLGLDHSIDAIAARDDVGKTKPNAEHAFYILRLLGVAPEETLFIGDHWLDSECARRAGLRFIHLLNTQTEPDTPITRYGSVKDLREILDIVKDIER